MAENIHEIFWVRAFDSWRVEFVSSAYETIWKRSLENLYQSPDSWMETIHPEDREQVEREEQRLRTTGEYDHSFRILWPDGAIRWIRNRGFPVRDARGGVIRIAGIAEDITDRKNAEQQSEKFAGMLRLVTNRLFEVQEEERRHLARELHDEIGQSLTAVKFAIEAAKCLDDPAEQALRLDDGLAVIEQVLRSVRALSLNLRPPLLDEVGLAAALRAHVQSHVARTGLAVRLAVDELLPACDPTIEIACYRCRGRCLVASLTPFSLTSPGVLSHGYSSKFKKR